MAREPINCIVPKRNPATYQGVRCRRQGSAGCAHGCLQGSGQSSVRAQILDCRPIAFFEANLFREQTYPMSRTILGGNSPREQNYPTLYAVSRAIHASELSREQVDSGSKPTAGVKLSREQSYPGNKPILGANLFWEQSSW